MPSGPVESDNCGHSGVNLARASALVLRHHITLRRAPRHAMFNMSSQTRIAVVSHGAIQHGLIQPVGGRCHPRHIAGVPLNNAVLTVTSSPRLNLRPPTPRIAGQRHHLIAFKRPVNRSTDLSTRNTPPRRAVVFPQTLKPDMTFQSATDERRAIAVKFPRFSGDFSIWIRLARVGAYPVGVRRVRCSRPPRIRRVKVR